MSLTKTALSLSLMLITQNIFAENISITSKKKQDNVVESTVYVTAIKFEGNVVFSDEELNKIIASDLKQELTLDQLKMIAKKVESKYHTAGYEIVKVILPQQDFEDNQAVKILILEGKLGKVNVVGNKHFSGKFLTQSLTASDIVFGQAFTLDNLENTLTKINRQSGSTVKSVLKPGADIGYTDIDLVINEEKKVNTLLEVNNYGSKSTGEYRVIPYIDVSNLTGRGDKLSLTGMHTLDGKGSYFANIAYVTPINSTGSKASAYVSAGNVKVGEQLAILEIQGDNQALGLGFQHDFIKSANEFYQFETWFEGYDIEQTILGETISKDKVRKLKIGGNFETLAANSRSLYAMHLHQGLGSAFGGSTIGSMFDDPLNFTKVTFDWTRLQRVSPRINLIPRVSAQYSFDELLSGEQISLGGYGSVVGHAPSAHSGDSGYVMNLEGRYLISETSDKYQFSTRLDFGQVFKKKAAIGQNKNEDLAGASMGFLVNPNKHISLRIDYGHPFGTATGKDDYVLFQTRFTY